MNLLKRNQNPVDVCLIVEGTYPYVHGGVSGWAHELIQSQPDLKFHILSIMPISAETELAYELPENVTEVTTLRLGQLPEGPSRLPGGAALPSAMHDLLINLQQKGDLQALKDLIELLSHHRKRVGSAVLLDSEEAWELLLSMYQETMPESSFIDYFWSWRAMFGSLFSVLLPDLPEANVYHSLSTGYAGILGARAHIETGRPLLLTEHGIYTNERRIELTGADWLENNGSNALTIDKLKEDLRHLWMETFGSYSKLCYQACAEVITLFEGNRKAQIEDGATPEKTRIIPNGIDIESFSKIKRSEEKQPPTIALIGRVVPIKDIKTFLRACARLKESLPDLRAYVMGPTNEDGRYFRECLAMIEYLALEETVTFTGNVDVKDYLDQIDILVLTSISEAQPLVVLEAGAAGVPTVATDVGACKELINGREDEAPRIGPGGLITPLASPADTAEAVLTLLKDETGSDYGKNMRKRVEKYYSKKLQDETYREVYAAAMKVSDTKDSSGQKKSRKTKSSLAA